MKLKKRENMKNPKDIKKEYDAWLKRLRVEQLKKFYRTFQAILAGQCNDDIDVVRGKISVSYTHLTLPTIYSV